MWCGRGRLARRAAAGVSLDRAAASLARERAAAAAGGAPQATVGCHGAAPGVPRALLSYCGGSSLHGPQGSLLAEIFATSLAAAQMDLS